MSGTNNRVKKIGLIAGFASLCVAVLLAHARPATEYELSVYAWTPPGTWVGLGIAIGTGVVAALWGDRESRVHDAGLLLVAASAFAVVTMPILRGYHFYGAGDSLSHLGWTREIATGALEPINLLYPAIHVTTVFVSAVTGAPLALANLYVVLGAYVLVFLLFVPLCVQLLAGTRRALAIGTLAALLFIPVNNISVHPVAHPASQAIMFFPFVLYLALRYAVALPGSARLDRLGWTPEADDRVTSTGILLALTTSAVVLIHPQQALNVALFFGAIAGVQALYRRRRRDHPITEHRPLYAQTAVILTAFLLWAPRFQRVRSSATATILSLLSGPSAGEVVADKSVSILVIGGNLFTLFAKLFLPGVVFSLLAGALIIAVARGGLADARPTTNSLLLYVTVALVPLFGVFLLLVASSTGDMYFRYQGFIMVPVTVLGAVSLSWLFSRLRRGDRTRHGVIAIALLFVVLVPVAFIGIHPSPYMLKPSSHVTQSQVSGFESAFQHRMPETEFTGLRGGPSRYVDAMYGTEYARTRLDFPGYEEGVVGPVFNRGNYSSRFDEDRYLFVTQATYETEVGLYDGFRYARRGFEKLETNPNVNRVRASDGFRLYLLDTGES